MHGYYIDKLSAEKLKKCYEIAPPRVQQYLDAEINYVLRKIKPRDTIIELGCGYGRLLPAIASKAKKVVGIDTSISSIEMGKKMLYGYPNIILLQMNALHLQFKNDYFDIVLCVQNGISAFDVNQTELIRESIRVVKDGGTILFSSYSEKFWKHRLKWFELQSRAGLLGEIDYNETKNGVIVCKDGFCATTVSADQFAKLTSNIENIKINIKEINNSCVFCEILPSKKK